MMNFYAVLRSNSKNYQRDTITVYELDAEGTPVQLGSSERHYRDNSQIACDIISEAKQMQFMGSEIPSRLEPKYSDDMTHALVVSGFNYNKAGWMLHEHKLRIHWL